MYFFKASIRGCRRIIGHLTTWGKPYRYYSTELNLKETFRKIFCEGFFLLQWEINEAPQKSDESRSEDFAIATTTDILRTLVALNRKTAFDCNFDFGKIWKFSAFIYATFAENIGANEKDISFSLLSSVQVESIGFAKNFNFQFSTDFYVSEKVLHMIWLFAWKCLSVCLWLSICVCGTIWFSL